MKDVRSRFESKKMEYESVAKTPERYEETVNRFLKEFGELHGFNCSGEYGRPEGARKIVYAMPSGEELFAVSRFAPGRNRVVFRYTRHIGRTSDIDVDGLFVDIKSPRSIGKLQSRMWSGVEQADGSVKCEIVSLHNFEGLIDDAIDEAKTFIKEGCLDVVYIVDRLGRLVEIKSGSVHPRDHPGGFVCRQK